MIHEGGNVWIINKLFNKVQAERHGVFDKYLKLTFFLSR